MILASSPERDALIDSAARIVRDRYAASASRAVEAAPDRERWREFADLGWLAMAVDAEHGGLGLPVSLASALAEALAPAVMNEPLLSQLALAGHALNRAASAALRDRVLGQWLEGRCFVALAHHEAHAARHPRPAIETTFEEVAGRVRLRGRKVAVMDGALADYLLVSAVRAGRPEDLGLFLLAADEAGLSLAGQRLFDGRWMAELELHGVSLPLGARLELSAPAAVIIDECLALFALLLAADSLGLMHSLLRVTHDYLMQREQFGRKLAEFQVLQHRVVDMYLATTRLESLVELARYRVDESGLGGAAESIAAAKAQAGLSGRQVGQQAIQLHGAIGLTEELAVGHQVRRLTANELLGGATAQHFARYAIARGTVPP